MLLLVNISAGRRSSHQGCTECALRSYDPVCTGSVAYISPMKQADWHSSLDVPKTHREKNLSLIYPNTVSIDTVRHFHSEPTERSVAILRQL